MTNMTILGATLLGEASISMNLDESRNDEDDEQSLLTCENLTYEDLNPSENTLKDIPNPSISFIPVFTHQTDKLKEAWNKAYYEFVDKLKEVGLCENDIRIISMVPKEDGSDVYEVRYTTVWS